MTTVPSARLPDCPSPPFASSLHEECGIAAIVCGALHDDDSTVARETFYALFALQHRGQEASGMTVSNGSTLATHKQLGLVNQVFTEADIARLRGSMAIGHTRYSTTGGNSLINAQPFHIHSLHGQIALAHNGNLTNAAALRQELLTAGIGLSTTSDTELMVMMLAAAPGADWVARIRACMERWQGAYSIVLLTPQVVYAVRDPLGFRPLVYGVVADGAGLQKVVVASESCALRLLGVKAFEDVAPGAIVAMRRDGVECHSGLPPAAKSAACLFEYIYFSRPDSQWQGLSVHGVRRTLGTILAQEAPQEADVVIAVPDSSTSMAIGYSQFLRIPLDEGFVKNRYIARTFIQPTDSLRRQGVALKFAVMPHVVAGKRVVVVDDSIVRGNTLGPLVQLLRAAGAREVHVRIASAPIRHPCFMGVDMGDYDQLLAHRLSVAEIAAHIGADSLAYLSFAGMMAALGAVAPRLCTACFSGEYPIAIHGVAGKSSLEGSL